MSDSENETTQPAQPVFPPIDATKAVPPVTPFPAWTWNTPVIPQFYWNVYSSEQRIRQICVEIGRIQAYLEYFAANSNAAHWYLDSRFTQVEARLTARVDKLEKRLGEEAAKLEKALSDETTNRVNGDTALQAQIDTTKSALEAETAAREAGDKANADAIAKETADREAADTRISNDLTTETNARENADAALGGGIDAEATARRDADTHLGEQIAAEHTERTHDVRTLATAVNRRPLATAITAKPGSGVTVEATESDDGTATGVAIGSTWQGDFATMRNDLTAETTARADADSALEARLNAETDERRHDDTELGRRIDGKLAFGAVRAGDGITVTNDPDTTTATVSAEVTKAKLDEAIAGIPGYELPAATADRLGGVRVGAGLTVADDGTLNAAGLEAVSHDDTMDGEGTAEYPLGVKLASNGGLKAREDGGIAIDVDDSAGLALYGGQLTVRTPTGTPDAPGTPGVVTAGPGIAVTGTGSMYVYTHRGLTTDTENNFLEPALGDGLAFASDGTMKVKAGDGLAFDNDGTLTATGAPGSAGDSESVKVVYPQATQDALGPNNTSGEHSVGEFLNYSAGVDKHGQPAPRFDVKRVEITKKQLTDDMGRGFDQSDFTSVNGGYFNGTIALKRNLTTILHTEFDPYTYAIASLAVVDFNTPDLGSMVVDGHSIITYFTATGSANLANLLNSIGDDTPVYTLYIIRADRAVLDIHGRN